MHMVRSISRITITALIFVMAGCSGGGSGLVVPTPAPLRLFAGSYNGTYSSVVRSGDLQVRVSSDGTVSFSIQAQGLPRPDGSSNFFTSTVSGRLNERTGKATASGPLALGGDALYNVSFTGTFDNQNGVVVGSGILRVNGIEHEGTWEVSKE